MEKVTANELDWYEAQCETEEPVELVMDEETTAKAMKRIKYFREMCGKQCKPFDDEIATLQAQVKDIEVEISRLTFERETLAANWQKREGWYIRPLEAFARQLHQRDPKLKSWVTPYGTTTLREQSPEWNYGDEKALAKYLRDNHGAWVRDEPVVDKAALKRDTVTGEGGTVRVKETGEVLPITVIEHPPKFSVKVG